MYVYCVMAYPVPNVEYFKVHLPHLLIIKQVEQVDELLPYDEYWWRAYVKMIPKSVKRSCFCNFNRNDFSGPHR